MAADHAMEWFKMWKYADTKRYFITLEALASSALSGSRLAQVCLGTLERLEKGQPVSDRYLLGLCWFLKEMLDNERTKPDDVAKGHEAD